jgi:hypothetical protein
VLGFLYGFADIVLYGMDFTKKGKIMGSKGINNRFSEQPLCKFGPGGDFVQELSPKEALPKMPIQENSLGKVLEIIAEMIGVAVGPELLLDQPQQQDNVLKKQAFLTEKTKNETIQSGFSHHHSQATGRIEGNRCVPKQAMLFADDGRIGKFTGHKTPHRIRTYRRTSRKRTDRVLQRQSASTLFTSH